jgi:molecular chaperone DnaK (HSP70)
VYLENQRTSYVITVPAIWSDDAKNLTRLAATRAGIPGDKLNLITEPEAAALYCATMCEELDLRQGDRFLVCDAGGGTVVNGNSVTQLKRRTSFLTN